MATVMLSRAVRDALLHNATHPLKLEIEQRKYEPPITGDRLFEIAFGQYNFSNMRELCISVNSVKLRGPYISGYGHTIVNFDMTTPKLVPYFQHEALLWDHVHSLKVRVSERGVLVDVIPTAVNDDLIQVLDYNRKFVDETQTLVTRLEDFRTNIHALLSKHNTLAQALSEWPPLYQYLSQNIRETHESTASKRAAKPRDINVDTSMLTAVATMQKLKG